MNERACRAPCTIADVCAILDSRACLVLNRVEAKASHTHSLQASFWMTGKDARFRRREGRERARSSAIVCACRGLRRRAASRRGSRR
eukprot:6180740-Pleurochrysis_carterae.AAC.2